MSRNNEQEYFIASFFIYSEEDLASEIQTKLKLEPHHPHNLMIRRPRPTSNNVDDIHAKPNVILERLV